MTARTGKPVCRWIAEEIRTFASSGLGHWPRAWEIVEEPSHAFLNALDRWKQTGSPEDQKATARAAAVVVAAWREAAKEWEAAGQPGVPSDLEAIIPA